MNTDFSSPGLHPMREFSMHPVQAINQTPTNNKPRTSLHYLKSLHNFDIHTNVGCRAPVQSLLCGVGVYMDALNSPINGHTLSSRLSSMGPIRLPKLYPTFCCVTCSMI